MGEIVEGHAYLGLEECVTAGVVNLCGRGKKRDGEGEIRRTRSGYGSYWTPRNEQAKSSVMD